MNGDGIVGVGNLPFLGEYLGKLDLAKVRM
jgi:hypothetical protein